MTSETSGVRSGWWSVGEVLGQALLLTMASLAAPATALVEEEQEGHEASGGGERAREEHHEDHHHKNHVAVFVGATEAEEHHGEKSDPDFTIGFDYERRINKWFGAGAMLDFVVEGKREYLAGPLLILHAGKSAKFFAAPCYQKVRESGENDFVFRTGFAWDFCFGKFSVFPSVNYDFAEEQDFLVLGVGFGMGF